MDRVQHHGQFGRMVEVEPTGTAQLTRAIGFVGDALTPWGIVECHVVLISQLVLEHFSLLV
jgi:hypothetical protein